MENPSQDPTERKDGKIPNFRPLFVLLHLGGLFLYNLIPSCSYFRESFFSDIPFYYYFIVALLSIAMKEYANACLPPGYATEEADNPEGLFYCETCKIHIPVRACHCRVCGKCILRRDHHCPWTNQCIGRDNHVYFFIFLITESIIMGILLVDMVSSVFKTSFMDNIKYNLISIILIPFVAFAFFQVSLLSFTHFVLITNNGTIWETKRRLNITYLKGQTIDKSPFNKGVWNNVVEFFTMKQEKKVWEIPPPPTFDDFIRESHTFLTQKDIIGATIRE